MDSLFAVGIFNLIGTILSIFFVKYLIKAGKENKIIFQLKLFVKAGYFFIISGMFFIFGMIVHRYKRGIISCLIAIAFAFYFVFENQKELKLLEKEKRSEDL